MVRLILEQEPKTRNGVRTLPMDDDRAAALRMLRAQQARERLVAGAAYANTGHVVVDEIGRPIHPEHYSDDFGRVTKQAGVKRLVLHEGRHSCASLVRRPGADLDHQQGGWTTTTGR